MINLKKIAAFGLAAVLGVTSLAACGGSAPAAGSSAPAGTESGTADAGTADAGVEGTDVATQHHKIAVGLYSAQGQSYQAITSYLNGIADTVDCEFDVFILSTYDEAANIDAVNAKLSAGCEGLILTADMGTAGILEACEDAGVYVAGFLCDYNQSFWTAHDEVFGNEYFLGTVCDGNGCPIEYGEHAAEKFVEAGYKHIGVCTFPDWAYPQQQDVANAFINKVKELDPEAEVYDIEQLDFAAGLPDDYLTKHADVEAIFSMAAGATAVYPKLIAANRTDVKLITTGFEATDDVENFGSNGNQCYQGIMCSAPEAIAYPLCLLIDKLNGTTYADLPETERVDSGSYQIISDEGMAEMKKTLYCTANVADAAISGSDIVNMCASYNPDATYAGLVEKVQSVTIIK